MLSPHGALDERVQRASFHSHARLCHKSPAFTQLLLVLADERENATSHRHEYGLVSQATPRIDRIAYSRVQAPAFSRRIRPSLQTFPKLG
jgi:hypothetical protein